MIVEAPYVGLEDLKQSESGEEKKGEKNFFICCFN